MLRRGFSGVNTSSSLVGLAATAAQTRHWSYVPKSDIWLDRFDMAREMNEQNIRSGKVPDYNIERFRNMFWRYDEAVRRTEGRVRQQSGEGFFFPILDYEIHKGVAPLFSSEQMRMHMKHHKAYIAKLNQLLPGSQYAGMTLDAVVQRSSYDPTATAIYNNAAQHYNHMFFWKSIHPWGSVCPPDLSAAISKQYGSVEQFQEKASAAAMAGFGSCWLWMVYDEATEQFDLLTMPNAGCPLTQPGKFPMLAIDLWEHTWYMDYENQKQKYVDGYWKVVDWHWAERMWKKATNKPYEPLKFL